MSIIVTTKPSSEPVTLDEAKLHLRVDHATEDTLISGMISSAREWVEEYVKRKLITQTLTLYTDSFQATTELTPNLQSVTSIKYIDMSGVQQTLAVERYAVYKNSLVGYIRPTYGETFPTVRGEPEAVEVEFVAGYGTSDDVPQAIKQAILLMIGDAYANREESIVGTIFSSTNAVKNLLSAYKVVTFR